MFLDDKHYAGDEDEQVPPPHAPPPLPTPPPPGTSSSGPGLTGLAVGTSLVLIALLAAAAKPDLRAPLVLFVVLFGGIYLFYKFVTRPRRYRNDGYDSYDGVDDVESNIIFLMFAGFFKAVFAIFTWGSKDD